MGALDMQGIPAKWDTSQSQLVWVMYTKAEAAVTAPLFSQSNWTDLTNCKDLRNSIVLFEGDGSDTVEGDVMFLKLADAVTPNAYEVYGWRPATIPLVAGPWIFAVTVDDARRFLDDAWSTGIASIVYKSTSCGGGVQETLASVALMISAMTFVGASGAENKIAEDMATT